MRVAILGPSVVPFAIGGAENSWLSMQRYINAETSHSCELIKLPTPERNLKEIVRSYRMWSEFTMDGFDRIISTKYPCWMVSHPGHVVHIYHKLRGLYDTFPLTGAATEYPNDPILGKIRAMTAQSRASSQQLPYFFDLMETLMANDTLFACINQFPGNFAREVVHYLDRIGLAPERIHKYAVISRTVAQRADHFPAGYPITVLPLVPLVEGFYCGSQDYIFATSRLDAPKRIGLLIEAMRHVTHDISLRIAGTGPEEAYLHKLADGNPKVQFLGHITDQELRDQYANCLACAFIPYQEDFGLVTIEAMRSSKPVITATDSGGPLDFVVHGETGLISEPNPIALASAITHMAEHRAEAKAMGLNAIKKVANVNWKNVVPYLLDEKPAEPEKIYHAAPSGKMAKRKKIVVASTFPFFPPMGGGQARAFNIFDQLSRHYDVVAVCLSHLHDTAEDKLINPHYRQIKVPQSERHHQTEMDYARPVDFLPIPDIVAAPSLTEQCAYYQALKEQCADADLLVAEHPYLVDLLIKFNPKAPLWLEAQNFELKLKQDILGIRPESKNLLEMVYTMEKTAFHRAALVTACSQTDLDQLNQCYGSSKVRQIIIENGFSPDKVAVYDYGAKAALRQALGFGERPMALFIGSWHGPNINCVETLAKIAPQIPELIFVIMGSVGAYFRDHKDIQSIENLRFVGLVDDKEKALIQACADVALNPMELGSGSNLKLFDYMANGIPVISTSYGARGFSGQAGEHYIHAENNQLLASLVNFLIGTELHKKAELTQRAADYVTQHYTWDNIVSKELVQLIHNITGDSSAYHLDRLSA